MSLAPRRSGQQPAREMRFRKSVFLVAELPVVYAFHENLNNITKVMPPGTTVRRMEGAVPARAGDAFRFEVTQFLLPLRWEGQWEAADFPERLVDVSRTFPFATWRHEHKFDSQPGGTRMTDTVDYQIPWYLGGQLTEATVFRILFAWMFAVRHRRTRNYFLQSRS
jgi:ligand-binding SRPBCC domain-containing protein